MLFYKKKAQKTKDEPEIRISAIMVWIVVALLTAVAAVIRLHKLGAWSFWVDEMFTLQDSLGVGPLGRYHGGTFPLSYILIGKSIGHFGISEWSLRIVPAIFGIATPAMVYLLARKSFGDLTSIVAAAIITISPWHLYWSQMARFYTMTLFFSAASMLVLHRGLETNRKSLFAVSGLLMALAALSHYSALLILAAVTAYMLLIMLLRWQRPQGLRWINFGILISPFIVGAIVIGSRAATLLSKYAGGYPTGTVIQNNLKAVLYMVFSTGYRLEVVVAFLALIGAMIGLAKKERSSLLMTCAVVIPLTFLVVASVKSHSENRYAFVILPAAALLAGQVISASVRLVWKANKLVAIAMPIIVALPMLQHDFTYFSSVSNGERWNYRAAADYLKTNANAADLIYSPIPMPIEYYLQNSTLRVNDLNLGDKLPGKGSWLVMEDSTRGESVSSKLDGWLKTNCNLEAHFPASSPMADYGLSVYRRK